MVLQAALKIRHAGCVTEGFGEGVYAAQISADRHGELIVAHDADPACIEGLLDAYRRRSPVAPQILERTERSVLFRAQAPPGGIISTLVDAGCQVLLPVVYTGGHEHYSILAPDEAALRIATERLARFGAVSIERRTEASAESLTVMIPLADLAADLTPRQLAVLRDAIDGGYYQRPRRMTMEAQARALGVSPSTVEEHRRKAEESILHRFGEVLRRHPVLARMALKKAGRPRKPRA